MIDAADSSIAGYLVQYGEVETAHWVLTCTGDELLRIGSVGHWLELRGPSTPSGGGMMPAKALALASVYVREGKPRDLVRGRRKLTGNVSVVPPEHRERRPSFEAGWLALPRDHGVGDDARDYWEEPSAQLAQPSVAVAALPSSEPEGLVVSDAIMRWSNGFTKYNLTEDLIRNDVGYLRTAGQFLIIERTAAPDAHYIQSMRRPQGDYQIEYRAGGPQEHFQAYARNRPQVVAALWGWCTRDKAWRDRLEWTNIGSMLLDPGRRTRIEE
ncbi:hypothetical protein ACQPXB_42500 [Amycolatopsis sp. CA-161197]|uniref:hypothetical protein n=1 Tax=Amycolatopsis sp. CA-161197 TaxID=3239922 RepID=UPI003D94B104